MTQLKIFRLVLVASILMLCSLNADAQNPTQTLRGRIIDTDSKSSVPFANIVLLGTEPLVGTVADMDGYFKLEQVPVGRRSIKISYMGYEDKVVPNILIISGKETVLEIELRESVLDLKEVTINALNHKSDVNNEMAILSARTVSVEESKRYAGAISDPARLVSSFAGVNSDGSGNNDIIVRGNNPRFIQWRLEGIEIPNPNHFSGEGLTGGPINALNSQMLANSEFYTGAFAPQYGNALAGIFDMKLRKGNNEKREYSFSLGVLGTDATLEGPFKKGSKASYLVNYRYSTLSLLDKLGILDFNGVPRYQDMSFKIFMPTKSLGTFTLFGLGGLSNIDQTIYDKDNATLLLEKGKQKSRLGVLGLKHFVQFNPKMYLQSTLSYSINGSGYGAERPLGQDALQEFYKLNMNNKIARLSSTFNYKASAKHHLQAGIVASVFDFDFYSKYFDPDTQAFIENQKNAGQASLLQGFVSWKWRITDKLTLINGLHSQKTSLNKEITIEPRSALRYDFAPKQSFTAGFGMHSNMTALPNYLSIIHDDAGQSSTPNKHLELSKAIHYVLGYENKLSKDLFLKVETYYQYLYNIPIDPSATSSYSLINQDDLFTNRQLVNKGRGRNLGLELTLEKYFSHNYYFLVTSSLFNSEYLAGDNTWRNTKFNGNYVANVLFGKEFIIGRKKNNVLGVNTRMALLGGRRLLPIKLNESIAAGYGVYDEAHAFDTKNADIYTLNIAINYRINKKHVSHEFKIDVQNVTGNSAITDYYYNDASKKIESIKQLPTLPILSYTLNF